MKTESLERIIKDAGVAMRARKEQQNKLDEQLNFVSIIDPIDARLRVIANKHNPPIKPLYGMAGGFQIVQKYENENWYKAKAAEHLLRVRHLRRWHIVYKQKKLNPGAFADIQREVALCRRRAMGKDMPKIAFIGIPAKI